MKTIDYTRQQPAPRARYRNWGRDRVALLAGLSLAACAVQPSAPAPSPAAATAPPILDGRKTPHVDSAPVGIPTSTQFDITGFLQEAHTGGLHAAGSATVNGHVVTIPANTIVILPGTALAWDELFTLAPLPYGPTQTGLALFDTPAPLATSEIHIIGNRVTNAPGGDAYIAGLVYLSQQSLNAGAGFISFIDYDAGELRVGGTIGDPTTGTRVRINDPVIPDLGTGRYSKGLSPDPRFTVDVDNPTIMAATGYPMCLPRAAPAGPGAAETDPLCPQVNRPIDSTGAFSISFTMIDPADVTATTTDPHLQAPLEVGDYITFSGILATDNATPTAGPWPGIAHTYVSATSIVNNAAIFTAQGTDPAYVMIDTTLIGTGGVTVAPPAGGAGAAEAAARTRFEGMSTDPSRAIHLYAIDLDPTNGAGTDRDLGTIFPDPTTAATPGRWRFRPPCDPFGTVETGAAQSKNCVMNEAGTFLPPTREVRAVIEGQQGQNPELPTAQTAANGLFFGQFHAPISQYIFPEPVPGAPIVPNNFETIPFLACGGVSSSTGVLAGPLLPWPGDPVPTCANALTPPAANAGPAQVAASGALVTLTGSATGSAPLTFAWTQTSGPTVALSDPTIAAPTFTAPAVGAPTALTFTLTVTNAFGTSTATTTVTVNTTAAPADTVAITNAEYRADKQRLILTATSSVVSATLTLTLQPYVTSTGTTFDPATLGNAFTNNGGGSYSLTVVGAPQPQAPPVTPLTARSSAGGVSPPHGLDRLR